MAKFDALSKMDVFFNTSKWFVYNALQLTNQ